MNITHLILRRLGIGVATVFIVSLLVFVGTEILPGDIAHAILGQGATPELVANIRARLGLDDPAHIRYFRWLGNLITGDLGTSLANGGSIADDIRERAGNTFMLSGITALIAVPLSLLLGLIASTRPGGIVDRIISSTTLALISVPDFLIAVLLVMFFSVYMGWLPSISSLRGGEDIFKIVRALTLPVITLVFTVLAHMTRMTRTAVLNVLASPAIEMAFLKGVPKWRIILLHALPNAIAPIINVIALNLAYLISGIVVIETMFNYTGLGRLMVQGVITRDIPLVQACAMIFCSIYILLNMSADIISIVANPRIRHPK
ncbi:MAG: ABC transporter permease [Rhodospirillales bacterium]|jgi:peptide/nickel transport system permease protein|nr:ABC transporter permease [Rhodospirillales bacterium]